MRTVMADLTTCAQAEGTVVVIDVLRAFTMASYAFAAGVREIRPVATVDEALLARERDPALLVAGEVAGLPVDGFDLSNSPAEVRRRDLSGCVIVHRTTAGTQGLVRSARASRLLAASFVSAAATARMLRRLKPDTVTFVVTGADERRDGEEDRACAEYIAALVAGLAPAVEPFLARIRASTAGRRFADPAKVAFPLEDLELASEANRFDHALAVRQRGEALVMTTIAA
ncbi:MAG: 2-phosphosulfolactate phosphatase [Nitriliruptorales bacterium]|nr:2-phosphosulfolactate phosphatase [Nitriliruptorales bacterium]